MAASASDCHPYPIYNARFRVILPMFDADGDLVTGATTPDSEISQDCGTFADCTNEVTELATNSGMYYLDLIATEMDTKSTALIVKSATSGMKTTPMVFYPRRLPVIRTGTAQAGGASTITLDSNASAIDDYYKGCYVNITNNTPSNALGQCRKIVSYVGSTKVATVEGTYGTNPSSSSTFEILATEDSIYVLADVAANSGVAATASGGRQEVNVSHWKGQAAAAVDTNGYPVVTIKNGTGAGEIATSGGVANADMVKLSGDSNAADLAEVFFDGAFLGSNVADVSPTTTDFDGNAALSASNDFYNGCVLAFTSGTLKGISRRITDYVGASKNFQFSDAFPTAPANNDTFIIIGRIN